jgi:hypothetical protein
LAHAPSRDENASTSASVMVGWLLSVVIAGLLPVGGDAHQCHVPSAPSLRYLARIHLSQM